MELPSSGCRRQPGLAVELERRRRGQLWEPHDLLVPSIRQRQQLHARDERRGTDGLVDGGRHQLQREVVGRGELEVLRGNP